MSNPPSINFSKSDGAYITKNAPIDAPIMDAMPMGTTRDVIYDFALYILFLVCRVILTIRVGMLISRLIVPANSHQFQILV
nr:hypothetical protein [Methanobacterium lacus]